jgi:hypothetical protein
MTSNISSTSIDATGTIKAHDKISIMVKAGAALTKGQSVTYDLTADDGFTVIPADAVGEKVACIIEETVASGAMGKCQVWGFSDSVLFASAAAANAATAGELGYASTTSGYIKAIPQASVAAYYAPVGQFLDSDSATGSIQFFISTL